MDKSQTRIILRGIDQQIEELKQRLQEIEVAREAFVNQNEIKLPGTNGPPTSTNQRRRLPAGIPLKWVTEVLEEHPRSSVGDMNTYILKAHGRKLADGTIRRVLDKLKKEGKLFHRPEEGTWEILRKTVSDDDLPF